MAGKNDDGAPPRSGKGAEVKEFRAAGRGRKCPICGSPVVTAYRPFCSRRCADLDLGRWLREDYRLPTEEPAEGDAVPDPEGASGGGGDDGDAPPEPPA